MTFYEFRRLLIILENEETRRKNYTSNLAGEISEFIVTNGYSESLHHSIKELSLHAFGVYWPDVEWFLYECKPGTNTIWVQDKTYTINSIENYLEYAEKELFK